MQLIVASDCPWLEEINPDPVIKTNGTKRIESKVRFIKDIFGQHVGAKTQFLKLHSNGKWRVGVAIKIHTTI